MKPIVYCTSSVFRDVADHPKVSEPNSKRIIELWEEVKEKTQLIVSPKRFPTAEEITNQVKEHNADFILCHLSHPITKETLEITSVKGITTSTAGFNHIAQVPNIIMTHTPSILDKTVADFTIALILTNLRNLIDLHNYAWSGNWKAGQKWDLDENLNNTMDNKILGIAGLGEIGREVVKRIAPWGVKIQYFDLVQNEEMEKKYENLTFVSNLEELFASSDIVSLHMPLNKHTQNIVSTNLLKKMKKNALLINTARGGVVDFSALTTLLKNKEIAIDLSFDVFEPEPITSEILESFKQIKEEQPERRFVFIPHNASSDADTRAQMSIIVLEDILTLAQSKSLNDLKSLRQIPSQRCLSEEEIAPYRITKWWN